MHCARVSQGNNPENKAYHYKKTNGVLATACQAQPEVHDTPLQSWRGCYFFGLLPEYSKRRVVTRHASAAGRAGRAFGGLWWFRARIRAWCRWGRSRSRSLRRGLASLTLLGRGSSNCRTLSSPADTSCPPDEWRPEPG